MTAMTALRGLALTALVALPLGLSAQGPAEARDVRFGIELNGPNGSLTIGNGHRPTYERRRDHQRDYRRSVLDPQQIVRRLGRQGYGDFRGLRYIPNRAAYAVTARDHRGDRVRIRVDARSGRPIVVRYVGRRHDPRVQRYRRGH